jgi:hypothetical protein
MTQGMLWLDIHQKRTIEEKVRRASEYFMEKYNKTPLTCYINNRKVQEEFLVGSIKVLPVKNMAPDHILVSADAGI